MKNFVLSVLLFFITGIYSSAQFISTTDVLAYLDGKTFTKRGGGPSLYFHEMGSQLTVSGSFLLYNPDVTILSKDVAYAIYYGITDPSRSAKIKIYPSRNAIIDRTDNSIYLLDNEANAPGSFPDMSKARPPEIPRAQFYPEYKLAKTKDNLYLATNTSSNTPLFYIATENLFNPDFHSLSFEEANVLCEGLSIGDKADWRLPNLFELEIIFGLKGQLSPQAVLTETDFFYWSTTKSEVSPGNQVQVINFRHLGQIIEALKVRCNVQSDCYGHAFAVRDVNPIVKPNYYELPISNDSSLFIQRKDLKSYDINMRDINELVSKNTLKYNLIWRMPTIEELRLIYDNRFSLSKELYSNQNVFEEANEFYAIANNNGDRVYVTKNMFAGYEFNVSSASSYNRAHVKLVRVGLRTSYLDKYVGSYKSLHPLWDNIEISKSNDLLFLKLTRDSTCTVYESNIIKSDTIWFGDREYISKGSPFGLRYSYQVISPQKNPELLESIILVNTKGQKIRAIKE